MSEWQDIETAPKDGTNVILAVAGCEESAEAHWNGEHWVGCSSEVEYTDPYDNVGVFEHPTHWMPLPKPPAI